MKRNHAMGILFAATMVYSNFGSVPVYAQETTNYNDAGTVQLVKDGTPVNEDTEVTINDQMVMQINDVNFVKESITRSITEAFSLFETVQASDISIRCAKISNDIDVFLVIDSAPLAGNSETAIAMSKIKETVKNTV